MNSRIPRPALLALTLLLVVGAISFIEFRLNAAGPGAAQTAARTEAKPPPAERTEAAPSAAPDQADEPEAGPSREVAAREAQEGSERERAAERIERKEVEFRRAEEIVGPTGFVNTDGVSLAEARGEKVVLLEFWTYSCYNCQNVQPHMNAWHERYAGDGLLVVGVHTPEFEFEKEYANVEVAVREAGIEYPVVLDNDQATWDAYDNRYWPAVYLIDADGFVRYEHFGEGAYEQTGEKIEELLAERDRT